MSHHRATIIALDYKMVLGKFKIVNIWSYSDCAAYADRMNYGTRRF